MLNIAIPNQKQNLNIKMRERNALKNDKQR